MATTSDMIRQLCEKMNISLVELCRCIGQTPQNFNKKLKRGTVSFEEMMAIAEALGIVQWSPCQDQERKIYREPGISKQL